MKPLKPVVFFLYFSFAIIHSLQAQMNVIDSLRNVAQSNSSPAQKLQAYVLLSGRLSTVSFNETIKIAEEGLAIAKKQNDSAAIAELNRNMGIAYYFKGDYEKATAQYFFAEGVYERMNKQRELAYTLNDIAKVYRKTRDLKRAGAVYDRALSLFEKMKDSSGIQMILNESGVVYEYKGAYEDALKRYRASLAIAEKLKDEIGKSWCYNFIAGVYVLQSKFELAEDYNLRALGIRQKQKDTFAIALSYSDLGVMYSAWSKYDRAQYYFEQSNVTAERMEYRELLSNNYAEMSKMANMTGNYKAAYDYFTWHTQLKDSIFNAQKTRLIEEISTVYETSRREQQIKEQQTTITQRNRLLYGTIAALLLSVVIAYLIYNRYKWKQQAKLQTEILKQQELAAKEILNAEEKERSRIARDLHDGVGQMMSAARMNLSSFYNKVHLNDADEKHSLSNIIKLVDDSCKEVRAVSHTMMPQVLLSMGLPQAVEELVSKINNDILKINFHTEGFEQRPDSNTETILYRVIQECVNNTLKHADAKHLDISLLKDANTISVSIEDDGKGFVLNDTAENSMGLKNIKTRIQFLKGELDIDTAPGKGTSTVIHVPVNHVS